MGRAVDVAGSFVRDFMHGVWDDLSDIQIVCACERMMRCILRESHEVDEDAFSRDTRRVTMQALLHVQLACTPHALHDDYLVPYQDYQRGVVLLEERDRARALGG